MGFGASREAEVSLPRQNNPNQEEIQFYRSAEAAAKEASKPLTLGLPEKPDANYGTDEHWRAPRRATQRHVMIERWRISGPIIVKALGCLLVPPAIFGWTSTWLSFSFHFMHPIGSWAMAFLASIIIFFTVIITFQAFRDHRDKRWAVSGFVLCTIAFLAGCALGDMNYLVNTHNYYFIQSLKSYSNIKPAEVSGEQLMDAGRVQFAEGTKLLIDMGMSFKMWDTYCVAPMGSADTKSVNSKNPGPTLASYDLWAVGKNCCKSDNPTFACGEYNNVNARSGMRQINEKERVYFNLAVQQAEAAYDITAKHPVFFWWTEDADTAVSTFFQNGFRAWVIASFFHMSLNAFCVLLMLNTFKHPHTEVFAP